MILQNLNLKNLRFQYLIAKAVYKYCCRYLFQHFLPKVVIFTIILNSFSAKNNFFLRETPKMLEFVYKKFKLLHFTKCYQTYFIFLNIVNNLNTYAKSESGKTVNSKICYHE